MQELVDACHSLPMMIEPQKMWLTLPYGSDTPIYTQHQNGSLTIRIFSVVETSCGEESPSKIWKAAGAAFKNINFRNTPSCVCTYIRSYFRFMVSLHRLNRSDLDKAIRFSNIQTFQLRGIGTILLQIQEIAIFDAEELQPTFVPWEAPGIQLSTVTVSSRMILT